MKNEVLYKDFSVEKLERFMEQTTRKINIDNSRRFVMHTGKSGCINYIMSFEKMCDKSEEELIALKKTLQDTLKEGLYKIDSNSLELYEYLGYPPQY